MNRTIDKWLLLGMALLMALLLLASGIDYRNTRRLYEDGNLVAHTNEVLDALANLLSTMQDAETGQRGFLITGEAGYLKPYEDALAKINEKVGNFKRLTEDNDRQQARIPRLQELVAAQLGELARTIELREVQGFEAAQKEVLDHLDKNLMDAIRDQISEMEQDEFVLLRKRQDANDRAYIDSLVGLVVADGIGLASILGFIWILRRHLRAQTVAEAVLHEQREWFRTTLGSIGDAVIATDTQGRITYLNAVAQTLTGWTQQSAFGAPLATVFKIINEQSREPVEDPASRALRDGGVVGLANHTVLVARDGKEWPIDDSAAPIRDEKGRIVGVVLVFRDVTERRCAELALQEANRRKDEFLAILSHELRNPLAPIRLAVGLLGKISPAVSELQELRDIIERQTSQLTRLLDDLLDISRIASGKINLRKDQVNLGLAVSSAVESIRPLVDAQGHELTVNVPADPIYVEGDLARLAQIFANLLNNAAKYTDKGGRISLTLDRQDGEAVVRVRDSGIGIPADQLSHVFEMFVQVDQSLERSRGGLGLGLSLVQRLIELHGGHVEARSEGLGRGSEFIVRLPALVASLSVVAEPQSDAGRAPGRNRCRILVADDNRDSVRLVEKVLCELGHEIRTAYDGLAGVEAAKLLHPDLVLLDIGMPKLNGYEAARRIRTEMPGERVLLVAMTGWGQEEDKRRAQEAGFDAHLTKPVDIEVIEKLLDGLNRAS